MRAQVSGVAASSSDFRAVPFKQNMNRLARKARVIRAPGPKSKREENSLINWPRLFYRTMIDVVL